MSAAVDGPPAHDAPLSELELLAHATSPSRPEVPQDPHHAKRWWILGVLGIAQLMVVLDATVVNIALPSAQHSLGFNNSDRQWIVTSYALAFGSLLLLGGRLADLFGRKKMFLIGLVGFAIASAVGGAANGFGVLVAARAVQGAFGALLAPAALSLLTVTFTESRERQRAFGIYGAIAGGGSAVGLLLGGVLTEYLSWRWCMYVNVLFAVGAFVGGFLLLHGRQETDHHPLDIPGVVLVTTGLFGVVFGFSHAETHGWHSPVTVGFIVAGVALLAAFVVVQTKVAHPVLPMRVVLDRNRGGAYFAIFSAGIGMFAVFLFLTYFLQQNLGFSAVRSGLAFLPLTGAVMVVSQLSTNVVARRVGPRWIIAPGMLLSAAGLWLFGQLDLSSTYAANVLPGTILFGAGLGFMFSSALQIATAGVDRADAGVASALVNTGQQVGGSIGTALLSTLAATAAGNYADSHTHAGHLAQLSTIHGYVVAFDVAAGVFAVAAVIAFGLLRGDVPKTDDTVVAHLG